MTEKETGWQFYPIKIIGVAGDEETAKDIVEKLVNPILERDASEGKGLFANETEIEEEDEDEDALLMVEAYNCKASLTGYWEDLKRFGVISRGKYDAFFSCQFRGLLLKVLNELATYISQNTDNPSRTKNHIRKTVKAFDKMPIWGLFFQILILQGLCRWLLSVNINEGDNGYDEAQSLYDWLQEALGEKLIWFCFVPYSDNNKIRLKPLTDYLYSTKIGQLVQRTIFSKDRQARSEDGVTLPEELNTDTAKKWLQVAIDGGLLNANYSTTDKTKTMPQKAQLAETLSEKIGLKNKYKPFEELWNVSGLSQARYKSKELAG